MTPIPGLLADESHDEIAALIRQLHETQKRLHELTGGEVDAVIEPGGHSYLLREAQEQLQQSESNQRQVAETQVAILNALPAHIALVDAQGRILSTNEAWRHIASPHSLYGPDFSVGKNYLDVCENATGPCAREAKAAATGIRQVLQSESPDFTMEYPCPSPTGQSWFLLRVRPVHHDGSAGAAVMHINITGRKLAEEQLRLREEHLRLYTEYSPAAIAMFDCEMNYLIVSRGWMEAYHLGDESVIGRSHYDVFPEIPSKWKEIHRRCLNGAVEKCEEDLFPRADGTDTWLRWEVRPWRQTDGSIGGIVMFSDDITKRKHAEDAERKAEARFRLLVDSNAQGVIFWNVQGQILGANDAFLKIVLHTREDLEKGLLNWIALTPPEYAHLDRRASEQLAATGVCELFEKEYIRKDGSRVPILLGAAIFKDNPTEGVCFVLDLSERKKLEQQFLRAQRMESIGTLAGGIAHDLNNILAPILMSIDLLKMTATDSQAMEILETIGTSAKRGADIVRQVLSFARGVEGERVEVQPQQLLAELESIIKDTFPKNIRLRFVTPRETWMMLGDRTQIYQILLNLCVNARDAMPQGGTLTVTLENCVLDEHYAAMNLHAKAGRYVQIGVTDTGTGMPPEVLNRIFEPFFTTKDLNEGTGLGLSTVMAIVKSHGGNVNVYSEPGNGTTFRVYIPMAESLPERAQTRAQDPGMPRGKGELILVVDDEASILSITSRTLAAFGYRVLGATDGAEATALYAQNKAEIALVLTDMAMPIMDGAALIRALLRINPAVLIVATSGLKASGDMVQAPLGIKQFLIKPYTSSTLLEALHALLQKPMPPRFAPDGFLMGSGLSA